MPPRVLRAIARRLPFAGLIRSAWKVDIDHSAEQLRKEIARLAATVEQVEERHRVAEERASRLELNALQIKEASRLDDKQRAALATIDTQLDLASVSAHVARSIAAAPIESDPFPHIVVESLFPTDVYKLVCRAIPPAEFFSQFDQVKQNIRVPMEFGPKLATRAWDFVDEISREAIRPAVLQKFQEPIRRHLEHVFGPEHAAAAAALPQAVAGGRLMLRREGYHLDPHRDPKRVLVTCLLYFAQRRDDDAFGTQVFRVHGDTEASYQETFYPAEHGARRELVKLIPFRPNTALMFVNSGGAHGADIPTTHQGVKRHSFQFYIGPNQHDLDALVATLPPERQDLWRSRAEAQTPHV